MESSDGVFCRCCGKKVDYSRDTKQFCDRVCKDRYHYKERRVKNKKVRFAEKIKADPLSYQRLEEGVLKKLREANDPILQKIEEVKSYNTKFSENIDAGRQRISNLSSLAEPLEKELTTYKQKEDDYGKLKAWIEAEQEALRGKNRMEEWDRFSNLRAQERAYDSWYSNQPFDEAKKVLLTNKLQPIHKELEQIKGKLVQWEQSIEKNKKWLTQTFLQLNLQAVETMKILPLSRPAKRMSKGVNTGRNAQKREPGEKAAGIAWMPARESLLQGALPLPKLTDPQEAQKQPYSFSLGVDGQATPLYLSLLSQSNPHVLAIGKSGAGKTSLIGVLLYEAYLHQLPVFAFDFDQGLLDERLHNRKGTPLSTLIKAQVIDASQGIGINPFSLPTRINGQQQVAPATYEDMAKNLSASLSAIFRIPGSLQQSELCEAIVKAYEQKGYGPAAGGVALPLTPPTLSELWNILLEKKGDKSYEAMLLRLKPFLKSSYFDSPLPLSMQGLFSQNTILNLSTITDDHTKAAICRILLGKLIEYMFYLGPAKKQELRLLIILDEAHFLTGDESLTALIRMARKYGIGLVLASHSAKDFPEQVFNLVGAKIVLRLEGGEARRMADNMGLVDRKEKKALEHRILSQEKLHGVIRNDEYTPFTPFRLIPLHERE